MPQSLLSRCKPHFSRLHHDRAWHNKETVEISEKATGGAGTITFNVSLPYLAFRATDNNPPMHWLAASKCADGAFVLFDDEQAHLHIVELKSKLTAKEWKKVKLQFEGMLLNAMAVAGVIELSHFSSVTCYIAYAEDAISVEKNASPVFYKNLPGTSAAAPEIAEWLAEQLTALDKFKMTLIKLKRNSDGNATHSIRSEA